MIIEKIKDYIYMECHPIDDPIIIEKNLPFIQCGDIAITYNICLEAEENLLKSVYITKEMLRIDIENTGIRVAYDNGGGQRGYKDNPSIERQIKVNGQMLKLLSELGITTNNVMSAVENEL